MLVTDLELNTPFRDRILNTFARYGLQTVSDVLGRSDVELLRLPNFGRGSLAELNEALHNAGFSEVPGAGEQPEHLPPLQSVRVFGD